MCIPNNILFAHSSLLSARTYLRIPRISRLRSLHVTGDETDPVLTLATFI
jgi:hypothetical protein